MEGPRATEKEEFSRVLKLVNYVFREDTNRAPKMEKWYPLLFDDDNLENIRIIIEDNKPVSHIGISECDITVYGCKTRIGSIGSVCTHPEYRKRGFATLLLEDCVKKLDEDEVDIMLVSGGGDLYKRADCVEAGRVYNFRISQDEVEKHNIQQIEVLPYEEGSLENIAKVYQREPVRFFRPLEDFRKIINTGAAMNKESEMLIIQRGDDSLGYLAVQFPGKEGEKRTSRVAEYSGVREAVVDTIRCVFDRYDIQELSFNIPFNDVELIYLFKKMGFKSTLGSVPGTIKIVNFLRLMRRFRPYVEERLGKKKADLLGFSQEGDEFTIRFSREQFSTGARELVQIVFGTYDEKEREAMPKEGEIVKILMAIFPLPFIWPGLNYV